MSGDPRTVTLSSRASQLAQIQTNMVRDELSALYPEHTFATSFMTTGGDHNQSQAIYLIGGKEMWTKELEVALREGAVDMLVHCLKDMPTAAPAGCEIAGVLKREDPVDCLIVKEGLTYKSLEELPEGSVVGTSSVRRVAQLKRWFPKLAFKDIVSAFPLGACIQSTKVAAAPLPPLRIRALCSAETCTSSSPPSTTRAAF